MIAAEPLELYRFGEFDLDVSAYELRRGGEPVRLERQPMDLLILLVRRRGELVARAQIVDQLWGKDVFVDVETGVHTAARKVRLALGDAVDSPRYVETVPGKGYRFIAPVEVLTLRAARDETVAPARVTDVPVSTPPPGQGRAVPGSWIWSAAATLAILAALGGWVWLREDPSPIDATLAVLPFENLTGDRDHDYLGDGLTEEAIAALGQIAPERLGVVGRTSVMQYKATRKSIETIGAELGVDYLVEGSIRSEGQRLRVMSKLIRVRDGLQLWAAAYDREPKSILALQHELSAAIAEQIQLRLAPEWLDALARRQTRNAAAYDLYLRGLTFANQRSPAATPRAIEYFQRATALDRDYALAWAGQAMAHSAGAVNGDADPRVVWAAARAAADEAARADPELAESQLAVAHLNWLFEWEWELAERAFRRAVALDPAHAVAHWMLGHFLSQTGRHGEAQAFMRRARLLDPLDLTAHALSSQVAFQARQYDAALEHARQAALLGPEFWIGHMMLGQAFEQLGDPARAMESLATAARLSGANSKPISLRGYILATTGRQAEAREVLLALERLARDRYVPPYAMALVHAGLGDRDRVFDWLERAYEVRDVHLMYLSVDAKWDPYRTDPRFDTLIRRCGFEPEAHLQSP